MCSSDLKASEDGIESEHPGDRARLVMEQVEWRLLPEAVERLCRSQGALPPIPPGRGACSPAPPSTFPEGGRCPPSGKVNGVPRGLAPLMKPLSDPHNSLSLVGGLLIAGFETEPRVSDSPFAALLGGNRYAVDRKSVV